MGTLTIAGGQVLLPDGSIERGDVVIDTADGVIRSIEEATERHGNVLDASDGLVIPGLVNAHCHVAMTLLRGHADDKPLHEWLEEDIFPVEAQLTEADVRVGAQLGMVEMIKSGTTGFCDMYFFEEEIADVAKTSGLRALLGYGIITLGKDDDDIEAELEATKAFIEYCRELESDRIHGAVMPHAVRTVDPETLHTTARLAAALDAPIHIHMSETIDDVEVVLDRDGQRPPATAAEQGILGENRFVAHGVHLNTEDIEMMATTGTGVAHCPSANMKLASGIAPVASLLEYDVPVGIGTDGPASNNDLDMFEEMRLAALLAKVATDDASVLPAATAFHLATRGGAALLGMPGGQLEAGAAADLAVIDCSAPHFIPPHDLLSHLVYTAKGADVRHTVCDGTVLMRDREVLTLDELAIRNEASERAAALVDRAA